MRWEFHGKNFGVGNGAVIDYQRCFEIGFLDDVLEPAASMLVVITVTKPLGTNAAHVAEA